MKIKLITIIFLLCTNLNAGVFGKFEVGIDTDTTTGDNIGYRLTRIDLGYKFNFYMIKSETYGIYLNWAENINNPFMDVYTVGQKFLYKGFFGRYEWYCAHPVVSKKQTTYFDNNIWHGYKVTPNQWIGRQRTVSIGYEFEIK